MPHLISRRAAIAGAASIAIVGGSRGARAAGSIVATTGPGILETAQRQHLLPVYEKASHSTATLIPVLIPEAITKLSVSKTNPPFDVVLIDEGGYQSTAGMDLFAPLTTAKIPNLLDIPEGFRDPLGFSATVSVQTIGIAYNPKKVSKPPTSLRDLWNPEYKGRIGITVPATTLGVIFISELAKLNGGNEENLDPGFAALKSLLPSIGTVAPTPGALAALFQQGQIDIAMNFSNQITPLAARGVDVAMAKPDTGWIVHRNTMHVAKNTPNVDLAYAYLNAALSPEVQTSMAAAPVYLVPTNRKVGLSADFQALAKDHDELAKLPRTNWAPLNATRKEIVERFNKEVRT